MKTHTNLLELSEDELKEELRLRHEIQQGKEEKRQRVVETAESLGLSVPDDVKNPEPFDKESLRTKLENLHKVYLEKVLHGAEISNILSEGRINAECLTKEHKHALELYRQQ